jgi:hypothetical protein
MKAGIAKPSSFTPATRRIVLASVKAGVPWKSAALACGVSEGTISQWRKRGRELRSTFAATGSFPEEMSPHDYDCVWLADQLEVAHAQATQRLARLVFRKAAAGNVQAAQWWLSRRAPDEFGQQSSSAPSDAAPSVPMARVEFYIPDNKR